MKHFGLLCILLILVHSSTQIPKYENCPNHIMKYEQCDCCKVTCTTGDANAEVLLTQIICPLAQCSPGTQIGYDEGDKTKEFPACCEHPICAN